MPGASGNKKILIGVLGHMLSPFCSAHYSAGLALTALDPAIMASDPALIAPGSALTASGPVLRGLRPKNCALFRPVVCGLCLGCWNCSARSMHFLIFLQFKNLCQQFPHFWVYPTLNFQAEISKIHPLNTHLSRLPANIVFDLRCIAQSLLAEPYGTLGVAHTLGACLSIPL